MSFHVDVYVSSAVRDYVKYGLYPGSMIYYVLIKDYDTALLRTSMERDPEEKLDDVINFLKHLPSVCHGDAKTVSKWINHQGLYGGGKEAFIAFKLECDYIFEFILDEVQIESLFQHKLKEKTSFNK